MSDSPPLRDSSAPASESSSAPAPHRRVLPARARVGGAVRERQRASRAVLLAVGLHLVVGVVMVQLLTFGHGIPSWLRFGSRDQVLEERLTYVAPRVPVTPTPKTVVAPPRVAATPNTVGAPFTSATVEPPVAAAGAAPRDTGSGAGVAAGEGLGNGNPAVRGMRPGYFDGRVWRDPVIVGSGAGGGGGDRADNLDSIMGFMLTQAADSLDSLNRAQGRTGRPPGDWTKTDKNGQKWGWDQQGIRLGKVMIPNALLALLPLNAATAGRMSGNMSQMDADRRLAASRADIMRMSERGLGEADFRKIANELRDRRESERRNRLKAPSATVAAPLKSGGENK